MLTPDELEDWIAKRTAESAESTSLHLWDWQAMCHLRAERDRLLNVARGCHDYNGGHRDEACEVFHHGVQTVINAREAAVKDPTAFSVRVLEGIGARKE